MNSTPPFPADGTTASPSARPTVAAPGDPPSAEQLAYDKFVFDKQIALKEIKLKEDEGKRKEDEAGRWTNPLIVAIIGAIFVGVGNVAVSILNGKNQLQNSATISANQDNIESAKSERASVLEILKLDDPEKVRYRLCVLLKLNQIRSEQTNKAIQAYLIANKGCDPAPSTPDPFMYSTSKVTPGASSADPNSAASAAVPPVVVRSDWIPVSLQVPGCGNTGCYLRYNVCGNVPSNMKATGNIRSSTDSFAGWGDWEGPPTITEGSVCRAYVQHSHNQLRIVSYQFEVIQK